MRTSIRFITLAALVVSTTAVADPDAKQYTLADIKALVGQKAYQEALIHLEDIAPGDRNSDWLAVAADAGAGYIRSLSNEDLGAQVGGIEIIEDSYPQLLSAPAYVKVRNELGLKAYKQCFAADDLTEVCLQHATKFVDGDPTNTALALAMAKLVKANAFHYVAAPLFARAVGGKTDAAACKDADLAESVIAALDLPSDEDNFTAARGLTVGPCWAKLKKPVIAALKDAGGYYHDNVCDLLKEKKALSGTAAKACAKQP